MTDSDIDLIRRAQADDAEAFCSLAERYARRIYLLAFHYCRNAQDAEDLSQEVWLKAYKALDSFRADSSFYTWLRRITINSFLNHGRSRSFSWPRQSAVPLFTAENESYESIPKSHYTSEETIYNKVLFDRVMNALSDLTPSQRLMFLLRHHEGMSYEEIAAAMGCSTGTVKKGVSRALAKLRTKFDADNDAPDGLTGLAAEY